MPHFKRIAFVERPGKGAFDPVKQFKTETVEIPSGKDLQDGQVLVKICYTSCEPAMRGWMDDARSYIAPLSIGQVMRASTVGKIIATKSQHFQVGDAVYGQEGWTEYAIVEKPEKALKKVEKDVPMRHYLSVLGMVAQTAYWGMLDVGQPREGETVVVSGAAGATGSIAAQIAKLKGCRVIGIAGGDEKCEWLRKELGIIALDYKSPNFKKSFVEATPKYVNLFFDNVGGDILNLVLTRLAFRARIVICGAISQYNATSSSAKGPTNYLTLISQRATMQGFIVFDYAKRYAEAERQLSQWVKEGKLKVQETVVQGGIESAPQALLDLFNGKNKGKMLVQVADEAKL